MEVTLKEKLNQLSPTIWAFSCRKCEILQAKNGNDPNQGNRINYY